MRDADYCGTRETKKGRRPVGRPEVDERLLFGSRRFAIDAGMEGGSKREGKLEEGDRRGHGPKAGRSVVQ